MTREPSFRPDRAGETELQCDVCRRWHRILLAGDEGLGVYLCNRCFERLDRLDRDHVYPAFLFAAEIIRNRDAAAAEKVR